MADEPTPRKPGIPEAGLDLPGPQVGDEYTDGETVVTVTAVGVSNALAVDPVGVEDTYPILSVDQGGTMAPVVPPPIIAVATALYEYNTGAEVGFWTNHSVASGTGRVVVLNPNGTWEEVAG